MKKLVKRTKIGFQVNITEEGGFVGLEVESYSPKATETMFKRLHKCYCNLEVYKNRDIPGYQ